MTKRMGRLAAFAVLVLAGCSSAPDGPQLGFGAALIGRTLSTAVPTPSARFRAAAQAGTPVIVVGVENRKAATQFRRETVRGGVDSWISPDNVAVMTRDGMLVGTRGLGGDMMSADASQTAALLMARRPGTAERFVGFLGGDDQIVLRSYICDISVRGARPIDIGAGPEPTTLMEENCVNPDTQFRNLYWVAAGSPRILQSRQWAGSFIGPLAIRLAPQ